MRRVYAVPDANGVITVSCGTDQIEIVVSAGAQSAAAPTGEIIVPISIGDIPPWKVPHAMIVEDDLTAEGSGVDDILARVRRELEGPSANPTAVVLNGQSRLDIHTYLKLSQGLGKLSSGLSLAAGFGKTRLGD